VSIGDVIKLFFKNCALIFADENLWMDLHVDEYWGFHLLNAEDVWSKSETCIAWMICERYKNVSYY
jgi:hypothetical protein